MEQDCHALIPSGLIFFQAHILTNSLFWLSLYPDLWIYKTFASRNFHIKNSFDTRNKHTARFLYVLHKIHNNNNNSSTQKSRSFTHFFFFLNVHMMPLLTPFLYGTKSAKEIYFALSKKNEGKCTHSFSTSEYWTFEGEQNFFSMKTATIHEEIWKLYSVFRRFFFFLSSLTIGKITKAELFCSLTVGYGVRFRSKYFFWLILS